MSLFEDASLIITPNGRKSGKIYALKPFNGTGDLTVVRATTATEVNASGVIVDVASNVARFDYTNGSCPSILVEPQRTNLALRSEEFDNSSWIKSGVTITTNSIIAPSGNLTADKLMEVNGGNIPRVVYLFNATVGQSYTLSFYLKSAERNQVRVVFEGNASKSAFFNSNTGVVIGAMSSMILLNNGWYRCSITISAGSSSSNFYIATAKNNDVISSGDNTKGIYIWGAQLEAGSNATSYIPTVASAVTRNADVISKTGISDLIGQTEGTIFVDVDFNNAPSKTETNRIIELTDGTNSNRIIVAFGSTNTLLTRLTASRLEQASFSATSISVGMLKIALSYSSSGVKFYVNGTLVQSNLSASIPATNRMNLGYQGTASLQQLNDGINSVVLWKTKLTDQQCINLTNP